MSPRECGTFTRLWRCGSTEGTNLLLLARRSLALQAQPERARIHATADKYCEPYVEGIPGNCTDHFDLRARVPLGRETLVA